MVSVATGNVILMAEKAYNASVMPVKLEIDEDCELYGTSITSNDYYITIIHKNNAENVVIPSNRIVGSLEDNSIPYRKLDSSTIKHFEYALMLNPKIELNTSEYTFTVKAGTMIISNSTTNSQFTLAEDIVFNKPENYGSVYCVLNTSTLETRTIRSNISLIINNEETVLALVKFSEKVIKGLFSDYLLNGKNVTLIPNIDYKEYIDEQIADITNATTIPMSLYSSNEYYDWGDVEVGQYIGFNGKKPYNHTNTYYNYHFYIRKGDKVEIKGKGSTGDNLLYVLVSVATGNVILMAEKAYNASVMSVELEITEDCELYGTSLTGSGYYIAIHKNNAEDVVIPSNRIFGSIGTIPYSKIDNSTINNFEYALLLSKKPELNADTFTVKSGTQIINNKTSNRQFTLAEDIVFISQKITVRYTVY